MLRRTITSLALTIGISLGLAGCQTTGGAPSPSAIAVLEKAGFKPGDAASFNKDIDKDDIRTTATYECETPRCSKDVVVLFGTDPDVSDFSAEFNRFNKGSPAARNRALRAVVGKEFGSYFTSLSAKTFTTPGDGKGLQVSGKMKQAKLPRILRSEEFHMSLSYLQRNNTRRVIIAIANDAATARRYASPALLD